MICNITASRISKMNKKDIQNLSDADLKKLASLVNSELKKRKKVSIDLNKVRKMVYDFFDIDFLSGQDWEQKIIKDNYFYIHESLEKFESRLKKLLTEEEISSAKTNKELCDLFVKAYDNDVNDKIEKQRKKIKSELEANIKAKYDKKFGKYKSYYV